MCKQMIQHEKTKLIFIGKKKKVTRNVVDSLNHLPEKVPNEESSEKPHLALLALDVKHVVRLQFECLYCTYSHRSQKQVLAAELQRSMTCLLQYMLNLASVVSISCSWRKGEKKQF